MPEKNREEFTADGWFRTGDVGLWGKPVEGSDKVAESSTQDAQDTLGGSNVPDNYLSIVGRSKDLIISGGFNIYPKEIETVIDEIPGVSESAVVGVPHSDFGEAVVAVVVLETGVQMESSDLQANLKLRIANFKVPKYFYIVDQLPRNAMGKVQKNVLRAMYERK